MMEKHSNPKAISQQQNRTKILVVEDHILLREGLCAILQSSDIAEVRDTAASAEEALRKLHRDVELVLLDISLPGKDGIWLTKEIKRRRPTLPILVLTMHEQPEILIKALEAGVDGYLTKWAGQPELVKAIGCVAQHGSYLQSRIAPLVIDALRHRQSRREMKFSEREIRIGRYLVEGHNNTEIAEELGRSVSTVKADLRSLYAKLDVSSRPEAIAAVAQNRKVFRAGLSVNLV